MFIFNKQIFPILCVCFLYDKYWWLTQRVVVSTPVNRWHHRIMYYTHLYLFVHYLCYQLQHILRRNDLQTITLLWAKTSRHHPTVNWCRLRVTNWSEIWQIHHSLFFTTMPANTRRSPNAGLMLGQRHRRWPNIKPALGCSRGLLSIPANYRDWLSAGLMLGQHRRRWYNINQTYTVVFWYARP